MAESPYRCREAKRWSVVRLFSIGARAVSLVLVDLVSLLAEGLSV
jgi:hypothetical protein